MSSMPVDPIDPVNEAAIRTAYALVQGEIAGPRYFHSLAAELAEVTGEDQEQIYQKLLDSLMAGFAVHAQRTCKNGGPAPDELLRYRSQYFRTSVRAWQRARRERLETIRGDRRPEGSVPSYPEGK